MEEKSLDSGVGYLCLSNLEGIYASYLWNDVWRWGVLPVLMGEELVMANATYPIEIL